MHLCFVDESGTPPKPGRFQSRYFVFGGLVIPEKKWQGVRDKLVGLKKKEKYRGELKWRYFGPKNSSNDNPMLGWSSDKKDRFRESVYKIVTKTRSLCIITGVCDAQSAYELGNVNKQEDIYFGTYKVVTERFQYFLQDITKTSKLQTYGIIVADHRNGHEDNRMREQHERLIRETAKYTSTYGNFIESLFLSPSHMSIGIQLADMIAGAVWRFHEHDDDTWLNVIKPAFRTDKNGEIDGFGVARFPKQGWEGPIVS